MMNPMNPSVVRLAIAQLNLTVGDLEGNCNKIVQYARQAAQQGARVLLTPELSVTGYPPEDLLLRPSFLDQTAMAVSQLCLALTDVDAYVLIGHPVLQDGVLFNAASVLHQGRVLGTYFKRDLPNAEVFDEQRYFASGQKPFVFDVDGVRFGVNICEDTWSAETPGLAKAAGADVLLVLNASPFHWAKGALREQVLAQRVQETGLPLVYANMVGGQDELVFDGGSLVLNAQAQVVLRMVCFEEELGLLEIERTGLSDVSLRAVSASVAVLDDVAQVYKALTLGVRDYVNKNRFPGAIIGLSGGVDSALTLAIAVDALGADRVRAVMMPSPYTADISLIDSQDMVQRLGVQYDEISIEPCMQAFSSGLAPLFQGLAEDTTEENLQARIRGTMLMALSNKMGRIVLTTGNKSEMATGYCTLYGDMAGGFAVIKDVFKTLVYRLCVYRNLVSEVIPERIITRPPSAELRLDQVDQDSLPPYDVLDEILARYMEDNQGSAQIVAAGFRVEDVQKAVRLLRINEYKRRQAPIGIRVTHRAFGRDWRYPITSCFDDLKGL